MFAARIGSVESNTIQQVLAYKKKICSEKKLEKYRKIAHIYAGVFTKNINELIDFSNIFIKSMENIDYGLTWTAPFENYLFEKFASKTHQLLTFDGILPFDSEIPWTLQLSGKKVLIISPFKKSIDYQIPLLDKIWEKKRIFKNVKFVTYQSINSVYGEKIPFEKWSDALYSMEEDIKSLDFDIALIGCGGYSIPLGSFIRTMNKSAITLCGQLQVLFGIYGQKVGQRAYYTYGNKYWKRPYECEKPKNYLSIENSRYW